MNTNKTATTSNDSSKVYLSRRKPASATRMISQDSALSQISDRRTTQTLAMRNNSDSTSNKSDGSSPQINNNFKIHHRDRDQRQCQDISGSAEHELASPRCQSRESSGSGGRCPSDDSNCSVNGGMTAPTPTPTSPVGLPLPATLAPAAAAALLPPQSAAMAAYFNAAATAAQQNRLLLSNPLAAAATFVQQSPSAATRLVPKQQLPIADESSILDFSTKRSRRDSDVSDEDSKSDCGDAVNLSNRTDVHGPGSGSDVNCPLDLSVIRKRRSSVDSTDEGVPLPASRKVPRPNEYNQLPSSWVPPINPYLAAVTAVSSFPKTGRLMDWNGKNKIAPNEATKALEKMSEMTRIGGTDSEMPMRQQGNSGTVSSTGTSNTASGSRHSAWQSHWLNKGADAAKDVFKCVWCKQSFPTLASLTTHMKETQHCGVNVSSSSGAAGPSNSHLTPIGQQSHVQQGNHGHHSQAHHYHHQPSPSPTSSTHQATSNTSNFSSSTSNKSDLNLLIKETMPIPRKLVRGQDVWLGKGAEQTRQILKCMWCGQSFRSLAEMTNHMQQTQHYTNIISQEQIISWKSSDDKGSGSGSNGGPPAAGEATAIQVSVAPLGANVGSAAHNAGPGGGASVGVGVGGVGSNSNSTVSAVLTCKVCDQAFSSLKELSNHMVKKAHYKEHIMRSIPETGGRRRQTREKRKKSLPVRKLLELERAQQDFQNGDLKQLRDFGVISTKITCERCGNRVETALFVEHIRMCIDSTISASPRNNMVKTPFNPDAMISPNTPSSIDGRKSIGGVEERGSPASLHRHISPHAPDLISPTSKDSISLGSGTEKTSSSPSVLNAIEQLIEKSFDTRSRHSSSSYSGGNQTNTPLGASILKRLGIDESVDYTKPLMDPQTMNLLRSYQQSHYSHHERSASESSSVSERGSSRLESITPERHSELSRLPTPRLSSDKSIAYFEQHVGADAIDDESSFKIKTEPADDRDDVACSMEQRSEKISVKKEFSILENETPKDTTADSELDLSTRHKPGSSVSPSDRLTAITPATSPSASDRSLTPRSCASDKKPVIAGSSLNALSSMFDNLNAINTKHTSISGETNNNISGGKKTTSHPLAALQKLCEKTDPPVQNSRQNSTGGIAGGGSSALGTHTQSMSNGNNNQNAGNMVAFSWACNDAVMTSDSIIKCSFCDTPFCSKGAYRHHLSKVHFVKECDVKMEALLMKSPATPGTGSPSPNPNASPSSPQTNNGSTRNSQLNTVAHRRQSQSSPNMSNSDNPIAGTSVNPIPNPFEESPQSKFLKYTELAKQLSSKYV